VAGLGVLSSRDSGAGPAATAAYMQNTWLVCSDFCHGGHQHLHSPFCIPPCTPFATYSGRGSLSSQLWQHGIIHSYSHPIFSFLCFCSGLTPDQGNLGGSTVSVQSSGMLRSALHAGTAASRAAGNKAVQGARTMCSFRHHNAIDLSIIREPMAVCAMFHVMPLQMRRHHRQKRLYLTIFAGQAAPFAGRMLYSRRCSKRCDRQQLNVGDWSCRTAHSNCRSCPAGVK